METAIKPKKRVVEGEEQRFAPHCIFATKESGSKATHQDRCFVEAALDKSLIQLVEEESQPSISSATALDSYRANPCTRRTRRRPLISRVCDEWWRTHFPNGRGTGVSAVGRS
jgi:hypothetical protein